MDASVIGALAQFGTAGLVGWMWLTERRSSATRERQLCEAHERIMLERRCLDMIVEAMRENTRVLAQLESGQRLLLSLLRAEAGPGLRRAE